MTSDGGQPPKPKDSAQSTLLGFPPVSDSQDPPAGDNPPRKPPAAARHPLPPPRGRRESAASPPTDRSRRESTASPPQSTPPADVPAGPRTAPQFASAPMVTPAAPAPAGPAPYAGEPAAPASANPSGAVTAPAAAPYPSVGRPGSPSTPPPLASASPSPGVGRPDSPSTPPPLASTAPAAYQSIRTGAPSTPPPASNAPAAFPTGAPSGPHAVPGAPASPFASGPQTAPTAHAVPGAPASAFASGPQTAPTAAPGVPASPFPSGPHAAQPASPFPSGPHAAQPASPFPSGPHAAQPASSFPSGPHAAQASPVPSGSHAHDPSTPRTSGTQPQFSGPLVQPAAHGGGPAGEAPAYTPTPPGPGYQSGPIASSQSEAYPEGGPRNWGIVDIIREVPSSKFVSFLKISARRAFRLRIEPNEVLPAERDQLERADPPIVDRNLQAFLAWRRSVLFLVAVALVPLTVIALFDVIGVKMPTPIRVVKVAPLIAEVVFLGVCWNQLRHWAHWRRQRRLLLLGWLLFMATPFVVFIYPLSTFSADALRAYDFEAAKQILVPFTLAMLAMLQLAPKAISLMPGLIRASLVIKLLFPGSSAPGWLIVVAAPIYALLAYVILIVPYQFTGSPWFVIGILGIVVAQTVLARAGFALAQPHSEEEAVLLIQKFRTIYLTTMIVSAVMIVIALGSLVTHLKLHWIDVVMSVLKFETNVLILTLICSDLVITNIDRARAKTVGRDHVEDEAEAKIAAFVSLDAPHVPPPKGPAPSSEWDR